MGITAAGYWGATNLVAAQSTGQTSREKITVLNPLGTAPPVRMKPQAKRLDTLDGKTIYLVNYGYPNDRFDFLGMSLLYMPRIHLSILCSRINETMY